VIPRFALARPTTLVDAYAAFAAADGDAAYIAGGTELLQVMKMGFAQFGTLIDLKAIEALHGITETADGSLRIGAATTHREIERSAVARRHTPGLARLEAHVANIRVRSTGTIGGNLAFAEPHSDPATFLLACGAIIELDGPAGPRELDIGEFILGPLTTAREADEVILAVRIPAARRGEGRAYAKLAFFERPAASMAVCLRVADGVIAAATVAAGSLTEVPELVPTAAAAFIGVAAVPDAIAATARIASPASFADLDVVADLNGAADYKRHLAGVLLAEAALAALAEAHERG
jgi:carbon-monoxide dehydrogenase medium subunit